MVMTSKHLLANLMRSSQTQMGGYIAVDGTYSVTKEGLPVLVAGTVRFCDMVHFICAWV